MSLIVKRRVFEKCSWDISYSFFYECIDFFYQCKVNQVRISCLPSIIFRHERVKYQTPEPGSRRAMVEEDKKKFMAKWGIDKIIRNGNLI
jgi:hypothetical protein